MGRARLCGKRDCGRGQLGAQRSQRRRHVPVALAPQPLELRARRMLCLTN
jgi:hypothetical protein